MPCIRQQLNKVHATLDLFSEFDDGRELESIAVIDADIRFARSFYSVAQADLYFDILLKETPWRQDAIEVWGKSHLQPRLTAWYGDPGAQYAYSGIKLQPLAWTTSLLAIKKDVEERSVCRFNSVLINLYRNEQDSVGWHSDDEAELGRDPVIGSLSLGETRTFKMRHKKNKRGKQLAIDLTHGSFLLMAGPTQRCWVHAIDKERTPKQPRINLTFRSIVKGR
jgi:alkylated DNA repair dioxygenase AlkB